MQILQGEDRGSLVRHVLLYPFLPPPGASGPARPRMEDPILIPNDPTNRPLRPPFLPRPRQIPLLLLESYLELLLDFAWRVEVIRDAQIDRQTHTVVIHLPASSCPMCYVDAIDFLCQSIREELLLQMPPARPEN